MSDAALSNVSPSDSYVALDALDKGYDAGYERVQHQDAPPEPTHIAQAFRSVPRVSAEWLDKHMKILVVGESGLGKTTWTKNMLAAYCQDPDPAVCDASEPTSAATFLQNPDALCTHITVEDEARKLRYHYSVQDTPGYSYELAVAQHMAPIFDYIVAGRRAYAAAELDPARRCSMAKVADTRVDVCLYFMAPHRLKQIDIDFIRQLSELVPVVPILAKADSMTTGELERFRAQVAEAVAGSASSAPFAFSAQALAQVGSAPPFAVVASTHMDDSVGSFWPVREYPWGSVEALRSSHSDMPALKRLLFEVGYNELKDNTEERYYAFREADVAANADPGSVRVAPALPLQPAPPRPQAAPAQVPRRGDVRARGASMVRRAAIGFVVMAYAGALSHIFMEDNKAAKCAKRSWF